MKNPKIPSDVFRVCIFNAKIRYEIAYACTSLLYGMVFTFCWITCWYTHLVDVVAFILIVRLSLRGVGKISTIVVMIVQDATVYFLITFTFQADLAFFIIFARVRPGCAWCSDTWTHNSLFLAIRKA